MRYKPFIMSKIIRGEMRGVIYSNMLVESAPTHADHGLLKMEMRRIRRNGNASVEVGLNVNPTNCR